MNFYPNPSSVTPQNSQVGHRTDSPMTLVSGPIALSSFRGSVMITLSSENPYSRSAASILRSEYGANVNWPLSLLLVGKKYFPLAVCCTGLLGNWMECNLENLSSYSDENSSLQSYCQKEQNLVPTCQLDYQLLITL
jgi:hypothetical protein